MATTKRERQKAARREKLEQMQRQAKRRNNTRRAVIVGVVAVVVIGTGALLFSGKSSPTTTTTAASTTTTTSASTAPATIKPIANPSPAGKFGTAPTVVVPTTPPPTSLEVSNLITGTGTVAKSGDTLEVQYVLATYSTHKVIQSSWTAQPFSFKLGAGQVIPGWDQGMVGMRVGGRRELIIPPALGYGANSPGAGIAKNDTLVFVVDLLKVTP
jgi:peptidylprolyl isomerase